MSQPISHKLVVRSDGHAYVISGNPTVGYLCKHATLKLLSEHKRSWQAVAAALDHDPDPCPKCGGAIVTCDDKEWFCSDCGEPAAARLGVEG